MSTASYAASYNKSPRWFTAISVLMIIAGLIAIVAPKEAGIAVSIVVGWLLIISGLMHFVFAWNKTIRNLLWESLVGVLYVFTGGWLLLNPIRGLASLTFVLAIYLVFEAILEFIQFFHFRGLRGSGWFLFHGIITLFLAAMIWRHWPISALWMLGTLVGVSMLFSGISRLMLSLGVRRSLVA